MHGQLSPPSGAPVPAGAHTSPPHGAAGPDGVDRPPARPTTPAPLQSPPYPPRRSARRRLTAIVRSTPSRAAETARGEPGRQPVCGSFGYRSGLGCGSFSARRFPFPESFPTRFYGTRSATAARLSTKGETLSCGFTHFALDIFFGRQRSILRSAAASWASILRPPPTASGTLYSFPRCPAA